MTHLIERLLHLRQGDLGRGGLLFLYHFLIISSFVVGQVVRDTLFLDRFPPDYLPYVDMTIAALVLVVVTGYLRTYRYAGLRAMQVGSLIAFAVIAALLWWTILVYQWTWLYPTLYIWVGIFGVMAPAQVWILIIYLLSAREKRMLGLVASGGIAGGILGGFLSNAIVLWFATEHLLFVMMLLMVTCAMLVRAIWRQWGSNLSEMEDATESTWNLSGSIRHIRSSKHIQVIAALIILSSIVTNIAGWQFKAVAAQSFLEKKDLAAFFGAFYGCVGILGFLVAQVLAPRLLVLSLSVALMLLPIALAVGTAGVLAWGALWTATILKGSDKIFRYSIEKPAVESLYFPVPSNVMMQVKLFIDTAIWRLGDGLAGLIVFIFATVLHVTARQLSWVNLLFLGVWLIVVYIARRQYVVTLGESLQQHRLDVEQTTAPVMDRTTMDIIAARLRTDDTNEILYALSLLDPEQTPTVHPTVRDLLAHPAAQVREKALSILNTAGDRTVLPQVEQLMHDEDLGVRTEALLYLAHHAHVDPLARLQELGDFSNVSIRSAIVAYLARTGELQNLDAARMILIEVVKDQGPEGKRTRLEAARLIGVLPDEFEEQLDTLIHDPDPDVARQAIRTVGKLNVPRFIRSVLGRLNDPHMMDEAVEALGTFGDRIMDALRDYIFDTTVPVETRREIPRVLLRIGTPTAKQVLLDSLFAGDPQLRSQIIASLNIFQNLNPEFGLDDELIETLLIAELMGHYRSYQIRDILERTLEPEDTTLQALRESMGQATERVFRLIKLLYPQYDLHSAHFSVQSENQTVRNNALEFLEHILKPELRDMLVPLLDPDLSDQMRVQRADRIIGIKMEGPVEALTTLIDNPDPWLKSCAAYTIGTLELTDLEGKLDECLEHPDPLLRETVRQAKARLTGSA